jgi:hypothetical protein
MSDEISVPRSVIRPDLIRLAAEQLERSNPEGAAVLMELAAEQETAIELARIAPSRRPSSGENLTAEECAKIADTVVAREEELASKDTGPSIELHALRVARYGTAKQIAEGIRALSPPTGKGEFRAMLSASPRTVTVEGVAMVLYECEAERGRIANEIMSKATGKEITGCSMEPWEECKDTFLGDARAVLSHLGCDDTAEQRGQNATRP